MKCIGKFSSEGVNKTEKYKANFRRHITISYGFMISKLNISILFFAYNKVVILSTIDCFCAI